MFEFHIYEGNTHMVFGSKTSYDFATHYHYLRKINPLWNDMNLEYTKDKERVFFRRKFKGSFQLHGNDYDWIIDKKDEYINKKKVAEPLVLVITKDGEIYWKGFFKPLNGIYDENKCIATFEEIPVFDEYSAILDHSQTEFNMLEHKAWEVYVDVNLYDIETEWVTEWDSFSGVPYEQDFTDDYYGDNSMWTFVKRIYYHKNYEQWENGEYTVVAVLKRDYLYSENDPGGIWVNTGEELYEGSGIYKWVRCYKNCQFQTYVNFAYGTNESYTTGWKLAEGSSSDGYLNTRARFLIGIIADFIDEYTSLPTISSGGQLVAGHRSLFIDSDTNPVTAENPNSLSYLFLFQKSDIKGTYLSSDAATKAMMTFEHIENWLKVFFNAYWYVDNDGWFRIEHKKYFEYGQSYTNEKQIGLDLTSNVLYKKQVKNKQVIKYDNGNMFSREHFECLEQFNTGFIGEDIQYYNACMNIEEDENTKDFIARDIAVDLQYIQNNPSDIANDGFVLVTTHFDDTLNYRRTDYVINELVNSWYLNGHLAFSNLQKNYFQYGRIFKWGRMNGTYQEFESAIKRCIQEELTISLCDEEFDPYKLVKTERGNGEVETAVLNLKTMDLTLTLKYDD